MTPTEIALRRALGLFAVVYPKHPVDVVLRRAYVYALEDLPAAFIEPAAKHLIGRSKWFPSAAEVRQEVIALAYAARLSTVASARAEMAACPRRLSDPPTCHGTGWQEVDGKMDRCPCYVAALAAIGPALPALPAADPG